MAFLQSEVISRQLVGKLMVRCTGMCVVRSVRATIKGLRNKNRAERKPVHVFVTQVDVTLS